MSMVIPEDTKRKYESYPKYKGSGAEWLGEIPAHWEGKPLKRVLKVFNGSTPKSSEPEYWDGDIPWVTPEDLGELASVEISETKRYITQAGYESCGTNLVPTGSLVLSTRAPIGHLAIAAVALCTNQGCRALVPRSNIRSRFSYYVLYASRQELVSLGQGSTFMELGKPELETLIFPLPKTEEQQAIADFLDEETSRIDELIAKKQRLIELLHEQRTALITHTVTKGLNPYAPKKDSGVEWLGEVPAHWEVKKLKFLLVADGYKAGPFGSSLITSELTPTGNIKVYTPEHIALDSFDIENELFLPEERRVEMSQFFIQPKDIVFPIVGTLGRAIIFTDQATPGILNQRLARIRLDDNKVSPEYIRILMNESDLYKQLDRVESKGAILEHITKDKIINRLVALPPLSEQSIILSYLKREVGSLDNLRARTNQAIEKLQEYRSALITAAVTGKIDVRQYAT